MIVVRNLREDSGHSCGSCGRSNDGPVKHKFLLIRIGQLNPTATIHELVLCIYCWIDLKRKGNGAT